MVTFLDAVGVTYSYPGRRPGRPAVLDVSFSAELGQLLFVLGPNGSGKSTLFRLLLGLIRPSDGRITLGGVDTASLPARRLARLVAYIPQAEDITFDFTAREVALMGRTPHLSRFAQHPGAGDHAAVEESLAALGIEHLADVGVRSMSGGERQLVFLARALCQESRVLVLDEPTSALDFANQSRVLSRLEQLADRGYLLIVSSHNPMHALTHAHRVLLLKQGRLIGGAAPAALTERDLTELYDTPMRLLEARDAPGVRMCMPTVSGARADPPVPVPQAPIPPAPIPPAPDLQDPIPQVPTAQVPTAQAATSPEGGMSRVP